MLVLLRRQQIVGIEQPIVNTHSLTPNHPHSTTPTLPPPPPTLSLATCHFNRQHTGVRFHCLDSCPSSPARSLFSHVLPPRASSFRPPPHLLPPSSLVSVVCQLLFLPSLLTSPIPYLSLFCPPHSLVGCGRSGTAVCSSLCATLAAAACPSGAARAVGWNIRQCVTGACGRRTVPNVCCLPLL